MKEDVGKVGLFVGLVFFLFLPSLWAASSVPAPSKPEAAMKGYLYEKNHDEIVSKAKKEGSLRALLSIDPASITAIKDAFSKKKILFI